jgi:hypothetical protein
MGGTVVSVVEGRDVYRVLVGKPEGKRPLAISRRRCGGMDWIDLAQDRDRWLVLVNGVTHLRVR